MDFIMGSVSNNYSEKNPIPNANPSFTTKLPEKEKKYDLSEGNLLTDLKIFKLLISIDFVKLKVSLYKKTVQKPHKIDLLSKKLKQKKKNCKACWYLVNTF